MGSPILCDCPELAEDQFCDVRLEYFYGLFCKNGADIFTYFQPTHVF